jgi:hypothetical protein
MIDNNDITRNGSVVATYGLIDDIDSEYIGGAIIWLCDWDEPTFDERLEMATVAACNSSVFEKTSTFGYTAGDFRPSRATGYINGQPYWEIY